MKKLHEKKGMTLVELIIAVAFTAIVIAAACAVLFLGGNFFKSGTVSAANQQRASLAETYIQRYASTAFKLSSSKEMDVGGVAFTLSDNVLRVTKQTVEGGTASSEEVASIEGIGRVEFQLEGTVLSYKIISQDGTYTLSGGTVLNNFISGDAASLTGSSGDCLFMDLTAPVSSE
ncbi:hypothetical protein [Caproiciproducens faecalis]|uniref:Prepilin-type N-terminal cleavage/methylation domain-containing protein n=1 Tax=Caproiciproducens faecalis TaxID=2820301 RepID=A0ABS7DJT0_9FIRM|nr:hypothetical protein [Caproiciproducens faecalis]MBW7571557.1 hypothetical protein [Caproiciproducens faecalis]